MKEQVEKALEQIRPTLRKDGGDVELVRVTDKGTVEVRLTGSCQGCPMSQVTLKEGIEKFIKSEIPTIYSVNAVD
ncbi:MAG: NifU family protein [Desulfobulbaceae bacterium]|nr:NifU family protein [Desulfobulbaceae bacterium]